MGNPRVTMGGPPPPPPPPPFPRSRLPQCKMHPWIHPSIGDSVFHQSTIPLLKRTKLPQSHVGPRGVSRVALTEEIFIKPRPLGAGRWTFALNVWKNRSFSVGKSTCPSRSWKTW
ncbi:hypothetical protein FALCPG4_006383 [Fusarium falciforme]